MSRGGLPDRRARVLFIAEAVSLAHVSRPLVLASALSAEHWDVHFASAEVYGFCTSGKAFSNHVIQSISPDAFIERLAGGSPLYTATELGRYVSDDLRLIDEVDPDVIVGDFRLSLSVSARIRGVPYLAITNAHWSPFSVRREFPFPEHPIARWLGVPVASWLFHRFQPLVFARHALPMNAVRRQYNLPRVTDLRQLYTESDWTLYADTPGLVPTADLPANHAYIGPVLWNPELPTPAWWDEPMPRQPTVYVTLGSTGAVERLPQLVAALGSLDANVIVATAGRAKLAAVPDNVRVADYLPGMAAAARADLVVCSGGSATAYQALAYGKPVVGVCSNMDQYLTMNCIEAAGAGVTLRAGQASASTICDAVRLTLSESRFTNAAQRLAEEFAGYDAGSRFKRVMMQAISRGARPARAQ